jgi:hypothetical protein
VLLREAGQTVANDLILATLLLGAVLAAVRRRPVLAGVLVGLAISVKPAAVAVVPVLLFVGGWRSVVAVGATALAVQLPFFLWPSVGGHGLEWILEPVGRPDTAETLRANSLWWPMYAWLGTGERVVDVAARISLLLTFGAAAWCGVVVRRLGVTVERLAAAMALPLFLAWATASMQRTNYQCWYLASFLLAVGMTVRSRTTAPAAV